MPAPIIRLLALVILLAFALAHARSQPLSLLDVPGDRERGPGEFGQSQERHDDALQERVTRRFLEHAWELGLAGAFAWRLSDPKGGVERQAYHSFEAHGAWRPAMAAFRAVSGELSW